MSNSVKFKEEVITIQLWAQGTNGVKKEKKGEPVAVKALTYRGLAIHTSIESITGRVVTMIATGVRLYTFSLDSQARHYVGAIADLLDWADERNGVWENIPEPLRTEIVKFTYECAKWYPSTHLPAPEFPRGIKVPEDLPPTSPATVAPALAVGSVTGKVRIPVRRTPPDFVTKSRRTQ